MREPVLQEERLDVDLVAFDLDNTLYDEGLYFRAAFAVIAPELARKTGVPATTIVARLDAVLAERGRHYHYLFTDVLGELGLDPRAELEPVLALFREIKPVLTVFPGVDELLADLGTRYRLGLVTSGMRAVQENKLGLLGIAPRFAHIVFSSTLAENKPGRLPFLTLLEAAGVEAARAVYVGDNPLADFRGANDVGMVTVRVHNPDFEGVAVPPGADARIKIARVTDIRPLLL